MLDLDSPRWSELRHACGAASDIPALLRQLRSLPESRGQLEPWFSLWSALAHQGDVYSASFAAVPHVVDALATDPGVADSAFLQFPAWVEICRAKNDVTVPDDLEAAYTAALARLPALAVLALARPRDESVLSCALSAIAVAHGRPVLAEAILELSPEVEAECVEWLTSR